jgi:hypothetical protein
VRDSHGPTYSMIILKSERMREESEKNVAFFRIKSILFNGK